MMTPEQAYDLILKEYPNAETETIRDWYHSYGFSLYADGDIVDDFHLINKETGDFTDLSDISKFYEAYDKLDKDQSLPHDEEGVILKQYSIKDLNIFKAS